MKKKSRISPKDLKEKIIGLEKRYSDFIYIVCEPLLSEELLKLFTFNKLLDILLSLPDETAKKPIILRLMAAKAKTVQNFKKICQHADPKSKIRREALGAMVKKAQTFQDWEDICGQVSLGSKTQKMALEKMEKLAVNDEHWLTICYLAPQKSPLQDRALERIRQMEKPFSEWRSILHWSRYNSKLEKIAFEKTIGLARTEREWEDIYYPAHNKKMEELALQEIRKIMGIEALF